MKSQEDEERKETERLKNAAYYIQIKHTISKSGDQIEIPKINPEKIHDKTIINKIESIYKINSMAKEDNFNLVFSFGKLGLKFLSHEFVIDTKGNEIHYYTLEL